MMTNLIEEMVSREDSEDSKAVVYEFARGRQRLCVRATTAEAAWTALAVEIQGETDPDETQWAMVSIDGQTV